MCVGVACSRELVLRAVLTPRAVHGVHHIRMQQGACKFAHRRRGLFPTECGLEYRVSDEAPGLAVAAGEG